MIDNTDSYGSSDRRGGGKEANQLVIGFRARTDLPHNTVDLIIEDIAQAIGKDLTSDKIHAL
jgi:hypothetical protein